MRLANILHRKRWVVAFCAILIALLAAGYTAQAESTPSPTEATHASMGDEQSSGAVSSSELHAASTEAESQPQAGSGSHGHGAEGTGSAPTSDGPDWLIVGGFAAILTLVVGVAAITKPTTAARPGSAPVQ